MLKKKNYQNEVNEAVKFYQTGNYQKTIEILIQLEKKVRDPNISWILANTFFKLHHYSASLEQTQKFIKLKNKDPINLNFLGNIFLETNQIQKALKTFNEVLSLDKSNKSAILNLIKIYLNTGKIKKSEDYLKELLKKEPENYGYHHSLIRIDKNYLDQISIDDLETNMNHLKENNLI